MRLRSKLTLAFLLVGLVPLTAASQLIYLDSEEAIEEQVDKRLESLAASRKGRVEVFLEGNRERFGLVASRTQLRTSLAEYLSTGNDEERIRVERILEDAVGSIEALDAGVVLDGTGRVVAATDRSRVGVVWADLPAFGDALESEVPPSFYLDPEGALRFRIAGPLRLRGAARAVLVLEADPAGFVEALLDTSGLGQSGEAILAARTEEGGAVHLVPLRFDPRAALRRRAGPGEVEDPAIQAFAAPEGEIVLGVDYRGRRVVSSIGRLEGVDWALVVKIDEEEAYAPIRRIRDLVALVAFLACVLTAGVALLVARKITRPIVRLTRAARRIGEGDLSPVRVAASSDELGVLVDAFNDMAARLRDSVSAMEAQVAERNRAEEESRHLAAIVESSADAIYGTDVEGQVTSWNAAAEQLYGYRASEVSGRNLDAIVPPSRAEEPRRIREAVERGERIDDFETVRVARDGRPVDVSLTVSPIRDRDLRVIGSSTIARDITRRREAERDLAYAEARLAHIIDAMPSIVVAVDPKRRVTHWNLKAREHTGLSSAETLGTRIEEVLPDFAGSLKPIDRAIAERRPLLAEKVRTGSGATVRLWDLSIYPLVVAQSVLGAVVRIDDVTDRVRMEEMMVQSEKMMSVGSLAAGMAHEINNPLGAILQGVQNIQRRLSPDLEKNREVAAGRSIDLEAVHGYLEARRVLRFLEGIREAGSRAAKIVSDMLSFSRQSGSRIAPADIGECLDTAVRLAATDYDLKKRYDFKHIEIVRDYDSALGAVSCDVTKIEQVFFNLLKNAAQAMAGVPERPPRIHLKTRSEDEYARIEIADNGPGMDEETRRRAFEPFFTTKEVGEGTGLGLSVSYFIVDQHGGTLAVESQEGEGTRFILRLPLAREEE